MLLVQLSLRNLLRQKRRNVLLGTAMAIGVMILVVANSFSHGISDIIFNRIMRYVTGHVTIRFNEKGGIHREIFRDRDRVWAAVKDEPDIERAEEAVGFFMRAIGNGKADNIILVGANTKIGVTKKELKELEESFHMIEGGWKELEKTTVENPIIVSEEKARTLNVKKNDVLRVRFRNMFGQDQAARLTIVGIMRNDNIFMQPVCFLELSNAKPLLGYRPSDTGTINIRVKDPQKNARAIADRIHDRLKPRLALIGGTLVHGALRSEATVLGFKSDDDSQAALAKKLTLTDGSLDPAMKKDGVILTSPLARALKVREGDTVELHYDRKFNEQGASRILRVSAVCEPTDGLGENVVLMNEDKFYDAFYEDWPKNDDPQGRLFRPDERNSWVPLLAPEWILLKRTNTTDDYIKKYRDLGKMKLKATTVDVSTMYETASDILKLEGVLNLITLSAVLVLFFIILLGVINTLRMTIRERTREIGTIRAIGMRREDVRNMFILETFFLTLFSASIGVMAGFGVMGLLSRFTFHMSDNPFGMLLVNGHVYFLPTFLGIAGNVLLIVAIAVITAYFPARRAADLSPAKALGHFE
jgi:ABC-type lipoprotein release transport system permease subunit